MEQWDCFFSQIVKFKTCQIGIFFFVGYLMMLSMYSVSDGRMPDELERIWKEVVMA
jgi:hypothetical protein